MATFPSSQTTGAPHADLQGLQAAWLTWTRDLLRDNRLPLSGDVAQWIRAWGETVSQVGIFNVNVGTKNPQLEREIVTEYSYGRQLGRMLDMLEALVSENRPALVKNSPEVVKDFEDMVAGIRKIKHKRLVVADVVDMVKQRSGSPNFENDLKRLISKLQSLLPPP